MKRTPPMVIRVSKPQAGLQMAPPEITKTDEWEAWVVRNASHFTLCWKVGPGQVESHQYPSLAAAIAAKDNPRQMVYAVTAAGRSVMIGPQQYDAFLKLGV